MLAFVAAEGREFDGFLALADDVAKLDWPLDFARRIRWTGGDAVLVADGPGPMLAGRAVALLKGKGAWTGLVSTGFCGGLDPALEAGDIFVANGILSGDLTQPAAVRQPVFEPRNDVKTGVLLSVDRVAASTSEKSALRKAGANAVEMEAAGIWPKAVEWNVPFYCIRVVTDTAIENLPLDFNRMRDSGGRFSRAKIVGAALRRPAVFPELMKLNGRCKSAAKALGDFVASCRF